MASYNITTRNGNIIAVPDFAKLNIDGLIIIGDQTPDWNEPYNLNFIALDKKIQLVEQLIGSSGEVDLSGITDNLNSIEQELATVKSSVTTNTTSVASINQSIVNINTRIDNVLSALDSKVDKVVGKGLSSEDFTSAEKTKLAGLVTYKAGANVSIAGDGTISATATSGANLSAIDSDILPLTTETYNIGSPTKRWKGIYVDEAYLSTNTLYIGDTPVMGTESDTIVIKADINQSINVQTKGLGATNITSEDEVSISTAGTNADVKVQATGTNSKVRFAGSGGIELSSPVSAQSDLFVSGNLTVTGNIVHNGSQFIVNATTVTAKDNIIVINQGEVGSGVTAGKAGIQIDRGDAADYQLVFDEVTDKFVIGQVGGVAETIATREYVDTELSYKVDKVVGKGLSTEDYTSAEKTKLAGLSNYTLPVASSTVLGGVKAGTNISIDANGVISANDTSVAWSEVTGKPTFSNVATSGSYSDLTNKPTVPTTVSTLVNDSGYQTLSQVNAAIQAVVGAAPAALDTLGEIATQLANDESAIVALTNVVSTKQDSLVLADFTAAFDLAK